MPAEDCSTSEATAAACVSMPERICSSEAAARVISWSVVVSIRELASVMDPAAAVPEDSTRER